MTNGVILSDKRTGSSFLMQALNSHPQIVCWDELFMQNKKIDKRRGQMLYHAMKRDKKMSVEQYLDWLYNEDPDKSILFRLIYFHENIYKVLDAIKKKRVPVIHLTRNNVFKKEMSRVTKGLQIGEKVKLDKDQTIANMRQSQKNTDSYRGKIKDYKPKIEIDYDNLFGKVEGEQTEIQKYGAFNILSNQVTYLNEDIGRKICDLLNIEYQPMWSNVSKRNPWDVSEIIDNYEKIEKAISKTEFSELLDD